MSVLENIKEANIGKTMLLTMPNGVYGNVKLRSFDKDDVMFENLSDEFKTLEKQMFLPENLCESVETCFHLPIELLVKKCKLELV